MQPILTGGSIYLTIKGGDVSRSVNPILSILCIDVKRKLGNHA